jgi:hypothetical protein
VTFFIGGTLGKTPDHYDIADNGIWDGNLKILC